jgi:hypothetical protein
MKLRLHYLMDISLTFRLLDIPELLQILKKKGSFYAALYTRVNSNVEKINVLN